jgi:hypothetical protein
MKLNKYKRATRLATDLVSVGEIIDGNLSEKQVRALHGERVRTSFKRIDEKVKAIEDSDGR